MGQKIGSLLRYLKNPIRVSLVGCPTNDQAVSANRIDRSERLTTDLRAILRVPTDAVHPQDGQ
jgi:hypothetical protein